jgi:hypothetical protein
MEPLQQMMQQQQPLGSCKRVEVSFFYSKKKNQKWQKKKVAERMMQTFYEHQHIHQSHPLSPPVILEKNQSEIA